MRRHLIRIAALAIALAAPLHAGAEAPPAIHFFDNPRIASPKLSPDGRYLAAVMGAPGSRDRLSVVNLEDMSVKVVAMFGDADVGYYEWVNDQRLVFDTADRRMTESDDRYGPGLFAVNRDGTALKQLVQTTGGSAGTQDIAETGSHITSSLLRWNNFLLRQRGRQDSDFVYIVRPVVDQSSTVRHWALARLNTVTGRAAAVKGPAKAIGWMLDQNGEPRLAVTDAGAMNDVMYKEGGEDGAWRKLASLDPYKGIGAFQPEGFGPDGALYVSTVSGDKNSLYKLDMASGEVAKTPLLTSEEYDFDGNLVVENGKLLGIAYRADVPSVAWLDPETKALQDAIDKLLPGRVNELQIPRKAGAPWVLVQSHSDVEPRSYILYHRQSGKLTRIGGSNPNINPAQMGRRELVRYKARDGLAIPAWVTYPRGSARKNLPMVVLVHGGPFIRGGYWGWDAEAQFLASRGYLVIEPEFRGSEGFGLKHSRAGWKQWGLAMQDDLADGAKWAIGAGLADPKRICIAGASYGGYAALMGLAKDPDLYQCGINRAGVTDFRLLYNGHWSGISDASDRFKRYGMPDLIGDLEKDAAQLEATSPLAQAAKIKRPLLMAYGGDDLRVPVYHGQKFYSAVKAGNPDVELVVYPKEGHSFALVANRVDFWNRVEKFLEKHIGAK